MLRETTSRGLCGLVCPSRTSEHGGEGDCVKEGAPLDVDSRAVNLPASLLLQGKYDEEEKMEREVLALSAAGQGSVDDIQGGSISYAPQIPGISIVSTSAAEPASKRAKQSNRAPEG